MALRWSSKALRTRPRPPSCPDLENFPPVLTGTSPAPPASEKAWAVAFVVNVAVTLVSALYLGSTGLHALNEGYIFPERFELRRSSHDGGGGGLLEGAPLVTWVVGLGWVFAWILLRMIIRYSECIVKVGHASGAIFFGFIAVYVIVKGYWIWSFLIGLQFWGYVHMFSKHECDTWSNNFKMAVRAIKSMPWTIRAGVLLSAVQTAWILLSAVAAVGWMASFVVVIAPGGAIHRASVCRDVSSSDGGDSLTVSCECDVGVIVRYPSSCVYESGLGTLPLVYGFWFVSLTWGILVIQNVVTATAAGAVASWYFSPPGNTSGAHNALYRATQGSFGSLCKAAAVTPVIRMWRRVSGFWQPPRDNFLAHPQDALDFSNVYVICFIGIYGLSCSDAHRRVPHLFNLRGMLHFTPNEFVVNKGVAGLGFAAVSLYVVTAFLLSTVVSAMAGTHLSGFFGTAFGFFVCGFSLVTYTMFTAVEVLLSGMRAVLVCFLQDMEAIPANHGYGTSASEGLARASSSQ